MTPDRPWTILRLIDWTANYLAQRGAEYPRLDAQVLLAHVLGCDKIHLYTRHDELASEEARQRFRDLVRRRAEGCPVAYLVGRKEFYSLAFEVNPSVLIPRPDTETLVVECLAAVKGLDGPRVLDVGTGSGNVAVTVAHHHNGAKVTATDVSREALAVAARNAVKHGVADRVRLLEGDLFGPLDRGEVFDGIVSNPPYVASEEVPNLEAGVRDYEPHVALDGGPGGFVVFESLVAGAKAHLKPGAYLLVEVHSLFEREARRRIEAHAGYELGGTIKDRSGHPRVLKARWRP